MREETRPRSEALASATTPPGWVYTDADWYARERELVFFARWACVAREEQVAEPGSVHLVDLAGESLLLTRDLGGELHAFYNVCRHRGTRLVDASGTVRRAIRCPYHAWAYGLDGTLLGTPNVHPAEDFDHACYPLWSVAVDTSAGFVFVNLAVDPPPLRSALADDPEQPLAFARFGTEDLRIGATIEYEVAANWKIIVENYSECLHCPTVHPELVSVVPAFGRGDIREQGDSNGMALAPGATGFALGGHSGLPVLPGLGETDSRAYYGVPMLPTLLVNYLPDHVMSYLVLPLGPGRTRVVSDFLFHPETIGRAGFDPAPVVELWDTVSRQDWELCERVQLGVGSRAYTSGVYPRQDRLVHLFAERYREWMGVPAWDAAR